MKNKKKYILFGAVDIGYRIEHYSDFIHKYYGDSFFVESFSKYVLPKEHYKSGFTYTCEIYKKPKCYVYLYTLSFFFYALFRYDIFHFFSGETILTRKLRGFELSIYKLFGKRVIMHFVGADLRSNKYTSWKNNHLIEFLNNKVDNFPPISEEWQKKLISDTRKYADFIIVSTPDLLDIIPEARYFPVLIDINKFKREIKPETDVKDKNVIRILHVPSNSLLKGSDTIKATLNKIKEKYGKKVEILLPGEDRWGKIYSITRYNLLNYLSESVAVVDQLTIGWYGLQAIEALLANNDVFCYIDESLEKYIFVDCPIINVNALNLEQVISDYIENKILKPYDAKQINEWVIRNHTIEMNNKVLLEAWGIA